jgi:hypothetical protein
MGIILFSSLEASLVITLHCLGNPSKPSIPEENRVVHCGSGVTACHTILALAIAELPLPKLYVGSWSEWSRNDREIATDIKKKAL